jgi:hypothetical protein
MRSATLLRLGVALAVVPLVVSAAALLVGQGNYVAIGDLAGTELITRDVGRHLVKLGPYSRDGWHHPGPALYYVLAVPYRLLGSTASALDAGALLVNAGSVVGMAVVARRRGGAPLVFVTLLGCALLMRTMGPDDLRLPWNPYITVLPYGLLVFLTWAMTCRERWALPAAVGVASFTAQTHIGYVALALPLVAVAVIWLVAATAAGARRDDDPGPGWRGLLVPGLTALGIGVAMWLPPVVEEVRGNPGNLSAAMRWFREGGTRDEVSHDLVHGWRIVSSQFGLPPEWIFGERPLNMIGEPAYIDRALVPVLLLVVAGAVYGAWRRGMADALRLVAVWLVASALGVVATARTVGLVYEYRIGWVRVLGMVAGVLVAWVGWRVLADRWAWPERRVLVPVSLVALVVLAVVGSVAHVQAGRPQPQQSARLAGVIDEVVEGLPPGEGTVLVDGSGAFESAFYPAAVILQLERRGIDARMRPGDDSVGAHRMHDGEELRATLVIGTASQIAHLEEDDGLELVAYDGERPLDEIRADAESGAFIPGSTTLAVFLRTAPVDASPET